MRYLYKDTNHNVYYMSLTCVSCFYEIPNKHGSQFYEWFKTTLRVNCPYVIFTTANLVPVLQRYRVGIPTHFVVYPIEEFESYKFKDSMIIHPRHCPSVELNLVWNEKISMLKKASDVNVFNSDWFLWVDAGICTLRNRMPSPKPLHYLPKLEKLPKHAIIYTSSQEYSPKLVSPTTYYHHVSGTYLLHRESIDVVYETYYDALRKLVSPYNIWTDQVVLTHMYKSNPALFYKLGDGYGTLLTWLYE